MACARCGQKVIAPAAKATNNNNKTTQTLNPFTKTAPTKPAPLTKRKR